MLILGEQRPTALSDTHGATVGSEPTGCPTGEPGGSIGSGPPIVAGGMERTARLAVIVAGLSVLACGSETSETCSLENPRESCPDALVCEAGPTQPVCVAPLVVRGRVHDVAGVGIAHALVTALDANGAPVSGTAVSTADGSYELWVPASRTADGLPTVRSIRLRASAAGFETFPSGLRRSLPIALSSHVADSQRLLVQNAATDILLGSVPEAAGLGIVSGVVRAPAGQRGVLVVAEGPAVLTAISDIDGAFTLFNVPAGAYEVRGYAAGVQLAPATAMVGAGQRLDNIALEIQELPLGEVSGSVAIVNAPGGSATSVVLVVASTFNENLKRGEVPPGLRAPGGELEPNVNGAFAIANVPDGHYVVLAAFENDSLVRDPDTSIGGTQIQYVTVGAQGRNVALEAGFKITQALTVLHPGAGDVPDPMIGVPTFSWQDDSSEDGYLLEVLDAKGITVWQTDVPKMTGGDVSATYSGPALESGSLYQFRVTSFRRGDIPISQTEDLRGVFSIP